MAVAVAVKVVGSEPPYTIFTDQVKGVRDYVWYTGDNLNANSALHVRRKPRRSSPCHLSKRVAENTLKWS